MLITSGDTTFFAICQPPILAVFFFKFMMYPVFNNDTPGTVPNGARPHKVPSSALRHEAVEKGYSLQAVRSPGAK